MIIPLIFVRLKKHRKSRTWEIVAVNNKIGYVTEAVWKHIRLIFSNLIHTFIIIVTTYHHLKRKKISVINSND